MKYKSLFAVVCLGVLLVIVSFTPYNDHPYTELYMTRISDLKTDLDGIEQIIPSLDLKRVANREILIEKLHKTRVDLKSADLWLRYLSPLHYRYINAPLPVEWETEVFEKWEAPYRRPGAGITLAEIWLQEENGDAEELIELIAQASKALDVYFTDSMLSQLQSPDHFYLSNRLYLLNLASIYTTGFECPDQQRIVEELRYMTTANAQINQSFNKQWPSHQLSIDYLELYRRMLDYLSFVPNEYITFDHFIFVRDYVNPLFIFNQELIVKYRIRSSSFVDYSLENSATSIFDKRLYRGQNSLGSFVSVKDEAILNEIKSLGKMLFFDPILSGNNRRSCASCHHPDKFLADNTSKYDLHFNEMDLLARNTPSLINSIHNHLILLDGQHISLQSQAFGVISNPLEMNGDPDEVLEKIMSCKEYKKAFHQILGHSTGGKKVTFNHIVSALTAYYSQFSYSLSTFDHAMIDHISADQSVIDGYNVFMGKAQCATCHFPPHFNGVKPPYTGSEFEVLGVPADKEHQTLSPDIGRAKHLDEVEMQNAFRTGTLKNIVNTPPYMHNGVFETLEEVIEFYDSGGGLGHGLEVNNQTLPADSLHLTNEEKLNLISFMEALTEDIPSIELPDHIPTSSRSELNDRKIGGEY